MTSWGNTHGALPRIILRRARDWFFGGTSRVQGTAQRPQSVWTQGPFAGGDSVRVVVEEPGFEGEEASSGRVLLLQPADYEPEPDAIGPRAPCR